MLLPDCRGAITASGLLCPGRNWPWPRSGCWWSGSLPLPEAFCWWISCTKPSAGPRGFFSRSQHGRLPHLVRTFHRPSLDAGYHPGAGRKKNSGSSCCGARESVGVIYSGFRWRKRRPRKERWPVSCPAGTSDGSFKSRIWRRSGFFRTICSGLIASVVWPSPRDPCIKERTVRGRQCQIGCYIPG